VIAFILTNVIASMHAYRFTHFNSPGTKTTKDVGHLSFGEKVKLHYLVLAIPDREIKCVHRGFRNYRLKINKEIENWFFKYGNAKGNCCIFHEYEHKNPVRCLREAFSGN
jgi:hypothetical protein